MKSFPRNYRECTLFEIAQLETRAIIQKPDVLMSAIKELAGV
ncbi:MAG: hypothetical protein RMX96_19190 [Nostoc sp. ChiSLP02]|nr:hypothetical protein [Nostoc sp. DedSLP05]MDZ8102730.1 hypothetical protein [Nostoc sp. DedSLP01]MDZ8186961.1 hypothetical protein [Nostoc sp. ChiSLP02]